jgi:hypothetical protein
MFITRAADLLWPPQFFVLVTCSCLLKEESSFPFGSIRFPLLVGLGD